MTQPARYRHTLFNLAIMMRKARYDAGHVMDRGHALTGRRDALDSRDPVAIGTTPYWVGYNRELGVDGYLNRSHRRWVARLQSLDNQKMCG